MSSFDLQPDPRSPVPLYHQIAEALRYRIATGAIPIGAVLPPLRDAALLWRVNLHTVRRAYAELAEAGIVQTRAPLGTQVLPAGGPAGGDGGLGGGGAGGSRAAFLTRVIDEARERHGLSLPQLLALLESRRPPVGTLAGAAVHVVECSLSQATDLARQLEAQWRVRAIPWTLDREEPPRAEAIVATYFHYNDLRGSWPVRFPEIRFVAISPDPALRDRVLAAETRRAPGRLTVVLCEREDAMLRNIAADVSRILPSRQFRLQTRLIRRPAALLDGIGPRTPVLVAPRIWGDLPAALRDDPRVHEVRYLFDPDDLGAAGRDLGWAPRQEA